MRLGTPSGKGPHGKAHASWPQAPAAGKYRRRFGELDIAVITAGDDAGAHLVREIRRTGARVQHIWPAPELIPTTFDVIYCDLLEDLPLRLPWLPGEPGASLVLIVDSLKLLDLDLLYNCAAHAVVYRPATAPAVLSSLLIGRSQFLYERRLRARIAKLDDNLRAMRSVERAKAIVMRSRNLSEEDAYHYLRRKAMARRMTIGNIANAIVDSQDLLGTNLSVRRKSSAQ